MTHETVGSRRERLSEDVVRQNLDTIIDNSYWISANGRKLRDAFDDPSLYPTVQIISRSSSIGLSLFLDDEMSHPGNRERRRVSHRGGGTYLEGRPVAIERKIDDEEQMQATDYLVVDLAEQGEPEMLCYFGLNRTLEGCYVEAFKTL